MKPQGFRGENEKSLSCHHSTNGAFETKNQSSNPKIESPLKRINDFLGGGQKNIKSK